MNYPVNLNKWNYFSVPVCYYLRTFLFMNQEFCDINIAINLNVYKKIIKGKYDYSSFSGQIYQGIFKANKLKEKNE